MLNDPDLANQPAHAYRAMQVALNHFYADALFALAEHSRSKKATAQGGPRVLQRVAREYGIQAADSIPLPRLTRAEDEAAQLRPPARR